MASKYPTLSKILADEYDAGIGVFDPIAILWSAEKIADTDTAKRELRAANRTREKLGLVPAVFPYGHRLF